MNRRFLRWVLNVTHSMEQRYHRYGQNYFSWAEPSVRWNSLMFVIGFTPFCLASCFGNPLDSLLNIVVFYCLTVCCWAVCINMWFFHRMRRKSVQRAKQRTRWMLNHTLYCIGLLALISLLLIIGILIFGEFNFQLNIMFAILSLLIPYFGTRFWVTIATAPFHAGYRKR